MPDPPVLHQIRFSHYNEKARWALDYKGVPHVRVSHLPGPHVATAKRLYGGDTLPALAINGEVVPGSDAIVDLLETQHPDPPLYPAHDADRALALELQSYFDTELGAQLRRMLFYYLLQNPRESCEIFTMGFGPGARISYRATFPVVRAAMRRAMQVDAAGAEGGRQAAVAALDRIEDEMNPAGYLVGDRFSVADLTAASLLFPLVKPAGTSYPMLARWPEPIEDFRSTLVDRPGFKWVEEIWHKHRGASAEIAAAGSGVGSA